MTRRTLVALICFGLGCAAQAPTRHVQDTSGIGAADRERLHKTYDTERAAAVEDQHRGQVELTAAQTDLQQAQAAQKKGAAEPALQHVLDAKTQWASTRVAWRQTQIECAHIHEWVATAGEELDKARIVLRNGADIDVEPFKEQSRRVDEQNGECMAKLANTHSAADTAERQLADAKNQYAHARLAAAVPSPSPQPGR